MFKAENNLLSRARRALCFCPHQQCQFSSNLNETDYRRILLLEHIIEEFISDPTSCTPQLRFTRNFTNPYLCKCVWCKYHLHELSKYYPLNNDSKIEPLDLSIKTPISRSLSDNAHYIDVMITALATSKKGQLVHNDNCIQKLCEECI